MHLIACNGAIRSSSSYSPFCLRVSLWRDSSRSIACSYSNGRSVLTIEVRIKRIEMKCTSSPVWFDRDISSQSGSLETSRVLNYDGQEIGN
jgi:hypothetical protein